MTSYLAKNRAIPRIFSRERGVEFVFTYKNGRDRLQGGMMVNIGMLYTMKLRRHNLIAVPNYREVHDWGRRKEKDRKLLNWIGGYRC